MKQDPNTAAVEKKPCQESSFTNSMLYSPDIHWDWLDASSTTKILFPF